MTEEIIHNAVLTALEDLPEGSTPEETATFITKAVKFALKMHHRMSQSQSLEGSGVTELPAKPSEPPAERKIPTPEPNAPESMIVVPGAEPPKKSAKPVLVTPGDADFNKPPKPEPKRAFRISSLKSMPAAQAQEHWKIDALLKALEGGMPQSLEAVPMGTSARLKLVRNIQTTPVSPTTWAAKVIYTLDGMVADQPGMAAGKLDRGTGTLDTTMRAANIARNVTHTFYTTDPRELPIQEVCDELVRQAQETFRPRERELFATTPIKQGHITVDLDRDPGAWEQPGGGFTEVRPERLK
jgi:hypothetical protein